LTRQAKLTVLTATAITAAVMLLFLWFASEVAEGETVAFDNAVRSWVHGFASPAITSFFIGATFMGSTAMVVMLGAVSVIAFLVIKDRGAAAVLSIIVIGEGLLSVLIKDYYARARPEPYFGYSLPASYSFPSGHSFASFCLYVTLAWLITRRVTSMTAAVTIWTSAIVIVILVGLSRVYLGVHYPTDVLAGYLAAALWASVILFAYHKHRQWKKAPSADEALS
jgi:undecaprenyl-diphosphatase